MASCEPTQHKSQLSWDESVEGEPPLSGPVKYAASDYPSLANPAHAAYHKQLANWGFLFHPLWWYGAWTTKSCEDPYNRSFRFQCQLYTGLTGIIYVSLIILGAQALALG